MMQVLINKLIKILRGQEVCLLNLSGKPYLIKSCYNLKECFRLFLETNYFKIYVIVFSSIKLNSLSKRRLFYDNCPFFLKWFDTG
jgi:hypothetical protein